MGATGQVAGRACSALAAAWLLVAPAAAQAQAQGEPAEPGQEVRSFAIPETSVARALFERAQSHAAAKRWNEAIADLQALIVDHSGEVLAGSWGGEAQGWHSQQPVHHGAAASAERLLAELPEPGRRLYLERFGPEALEALARARASGERDALARVARRYPLTPAAREAWWSLGDFEFELGEHEAARAAWQRAARATREAGLELGAGALQRLELAFPAEGGPGAAQAQAPAELAPPGPEAQSWRVRVDEPSSWYPFHVGYRGGGFNLLPVCTDDRVLVSNSLRLFAFDAWSGRELWRSAEAPGWEDVDQGRAKDGEGDTLRRQDFFHAVDHASVLIAPAASGRIAVAALQIPVSQVGNKRYQRIPITTVIPDRRLFAFDLETGEPLWNHMPPRDWDGESGEFAGRMRVAGPPVVAGSRVLVPAYRLQGRIEYHVACYDLGSGELLWSTALISGQVSLNMFGRQSREFAAAPLVVHGERVLALTQLGAMAALDLYTGDILWETLYDSLPLPRNEYGLDTPTRPQRWNNSAPLVEGNVVLATPLDSNDLVALELESGALLWSLSWRSLVGSRSSSERWTLLGADEQTVYLSGTSIVACRAPAGLAGPRPPSEIVPSPPISSDNPPRAAFGPRWIVAPTAGKRVVFDRLNLRIEDRLLSLPLDDDQEGNAVLHGGALFTLNGKVLSGIFDWRIQERRFEDALARDPADHALALAYAGLLVDRAGAALGAAELPRALTHLRRAGTELEARLLDPDEDVRRRAAAGLYRALSTEAEVLVLQADSSAALARLERARELAGTPAERRDTLLELARLRRVRGEDEERLALLDELEQCCGDLPMRAPGPDAAEFDPSPTAPTRSVALWAHLERAAIHAQSGDVAAELEDLHAVLARWGDVRLAESESAPPVSERIAALLELEGAQAYAPFEDRARAALESALALEDGAALERVVALYPHSAAAREAVRARRDQAWRAGEPEVLARLLQDSPADDDDTLAGLVQLAALLRRSGNLDFEAGLLAALARERAELVPAEPPGPSLGERARLAQLAAAPRAERAPATFDAEGSLPPRRLAGRWSVLGGVPRRAADELSEELLIVAGGEDRGRRTLMALRPVPGADEAWMVTHERGRPLRSGGTEHVSSADALVLVDAAGLLALDPDDGQELWRRSFGGQAITSLAGGSGMVVVGLESPDSGERLMAFDSVRGVPLWQHDLAPGVPTWPALVGEDVCVILPRQAESGPALVLDLYRGRVLRRMTLEHDVGEADRRGAWIRDGRLLLPGFPHAGARDKPCLQAYDLDSARSAWRVGPLEGYDLDSIVRHGRDAYLVLFGLSFAGAPPGSVLQLDTRLGAVRPVPGAEPSPGNTPVGVRRAEVVEIDEPYLFLIASGQNNRECLLRALHLPYGERWQQHVGIAPGELYDDLPPLPAQTRSSLVMAFADGQRAANARGGGRVNLQIFDRASGVPRDLRPLDDLGRAQNLELVPFGPSLVVVGAQAMVILSKKQP
jgi:outer membrane protein assembly factor BamB